MMGTITAALLLMLRLAAGLLTPTTLAESWEYHFEEAGVSVSLPADLRVLKYPVEEGDPYIPLTGCYTADELNAYYETTGTLLEGYFPNSGAFLSVESFADEESLSYGAFRGLSSEELEAIAEGETLTWGDTAEITAEVRTFGGQPFVCCTQTASGEVMMRYFRTVYEDRWFHLSLYSSVSGAALTEGELRALDNAAYTLAFDGGEEPGVSASDAAYMVLFAVGLALFLLTVILIARSIRRAPKQPPVLPGFLCRVSTPAGLMDFYGRYFVLFPSWGEPVSYLYEQTGGVLEAERCFWVYPPNRAPIPVPKNAFLAGEPEKLRPLCGGTERRS